MAALKTFVFKKSDRVCRISWSQRQPPLSPSNILTVPDHVGDQGAHGQTDTNTTCREAVRRGAARKARALSKHRPVLLRWAPSTTCTSPQQQPQRQRRRSRQQQQHTQTNKDERKISNYGSRASSEDVPPAAATTVRSEEFRGRDELVAPQLSLVTTESLGRHIVAGTGGIPVGTVVLKEAPYAWALTPEFHGEFCAHCLREVRAAVWNGALVAHVQVSTSFAMFLILFDAGRYAVSDRCTFLTRIHSSSDVSRPAIKLCWEATFALSPKLRCDTAPHRAPIRSTPTNRPFPRLSAPTAAWLHTAALRAQNSPSNRGTAANV